MRAAAEAKLRQIQSTTNELLAQMDSTDPCGAELLRAEATRLAGIGFTLTRLLCYDDVQRAYAVCCGDADEEGDVLGMAI